MTNVHRLTIQVRQPIAIEHREFPTQHSAASLQALVDSSTVVASGIQNVSGEWLRFVQNRVEENLKNFEELMSCRTVQDCLALQTRIVRDNVEAVLQSAGRTSELSTKLADDAVKQMSEQR